MVKVNYPHRDEYLPGREIENLAGQGVTSDKPWHYVYNGRFL